MSDSVGQYLNEIGAVALLTADDEKMLSKAEKGVTRVVLDGEELPLRNDALYEQPYVTPKLLETGSFANLRLVVSIARRYPHRQQWSF